MKNLFAAGLVLLFAMGVVGGTTYYLDAVNGSDTNDGSSAKPWKSMNKAKVALQPGDVVYLRTGNYGAVEFTSKTQLGSSAGYKTYRADPATCAPRPADWWTVPMAKSTNGKAVFSSLSLYTSPKQYLHFEGITINGGGFIVSDLASHLVLKDLDLFGPGQEGTAFYFRQRTGATTMFNDITVEGCYLTEYSRGIFQMGTTGANLVFKGNHLYKLTGSAISMRSGTANAPILIEGNHVHTYIHTDGAHASGLSIRRGNLIIRGNVVHNFGSTATLFTYDCSNENTVVENNLFYDPRNTSNSTKFTGIANNFTCRNNTFIGRDIGKSYGYEYMVGLSIGGPAAGTDLTTITIANNIVVGRLGAPLELGSRVRNNIAFWADASLAANNIIKTDREYWEGSGTFFKGSALFDQYAFKSIGGATHDKTMNDAFQLATGSPAIGYADAGEATAADIVGFTRDNDPDAGAYEYTTTGLHPEIPNPMYQIPTQTHLGWLNKGVYLITGKYVGNVSRANNTGVYLVNEDGMLNKVVVTR